MIGSAEAGWTLPAVGTGYRVLITERAGGYELRIRELHLVVRGPDLQKAHDELMTRKHEIIDWARSLDALDELPLPEPPPPVTGRVRHRFGAVGAAASWVGRALARMF